MTKEFVRTTEMIRLQIKEYSGVSEDEILRAQNFAFQSIKNAEIWNLTNCCSSLELSCVYSALCAFHDEVLSVSSEECSVGNDDKNLADWLETLEAGRPAEFCGMEYRYSIMTWDKMDVPFLPPGPYTVVRIHAQSAGPNAPGEYLILR